MSARTSAVPATAPGQAPSGTGPPGRRLGLALLVIATAQLMVVLDSGDGLLEELPADAAGQRAAARCAQTKSSMLRDRIFLRYRGG